MTWREACDTCDAALKASLRIAILGRPTAPQGLSAGTFWAMTALGIAVAILVAYFGAEAPRRFSTAGLQSEGFFVLMTLLACFLVTRLHRRTESIWPLATLVIAASYFFGAVTTLVQDHLLVRAMEHHYRWYFAFLAVAVAWWMEIWRRALSVLSIGASEARRLATALVIVGVLTLLGFVLAGDRLWEKDYAAAYHQKPRDPPLIAEEVFTRQPELLERSLAALAPGVPGQPDLYFVAFAPYGDQDVFLRESLYATRQFEERFGGKGRALTLANNPKRVADIPLASVTNLDRSLRSIAARMNREEDILFLFLTSHGSRRAELSVEMEGLSFKPLTAPVLASLLGASGVKWKVLVVSSCYSGNFIDALKDDYTLVISAARADRTSFGCSDTAEFTYFGRAYFQHGLNETTSFVDAFAIASKLVAEWEAKEGYTHSEPQMARGQFIDGKLAEWNAALLRSRTIAPEGPSLAVTGQNAAVGD